MTNQGKVIYCFDTGAFIQAWHEHYPIESFPTLWAKFDDLITDGKLISIDAVFEELKRQDDDLFKWIKKRKSVFLKHDVKVQQAVSQTLSVVPALYEADKDRSGADPYVVAAAKVYSAVVVSNEKRTAKRKSITIHQACQKLNIPSMNLVEMIKKQPWRF